MTQSSVLFVFIAFDKEIIEAWKVFFCVCVIMATTVLELATTLKYLGAKWLPEKKLILHPIN